MYNEGDTKKAEDFLNCGIYMYYERILQKREWIKKHNKMVEDQLSNEK